MLKLVSRLNVLLYRLTRGRVGGRFGRVPVLLLTTARRKPGRRHTVPLLYVEDGDSLVVIGSKGGNPRHPDWYFNLQRDPRCLVEIRGGKTPMIAETVDPDARGPLWDRAVAAYRGYAEYQKKTTRTIPLVRLTKAP